MNNATNALRQEALSGNTAKFLLPLPGFHSYLPALFQAQVRAFHSFCALLITPLSAEITVGLGDERGTKQEDRCSYRFSPKLNGERQEHTHWSVILVCFSFCAPTEVTHAAVLWASPIASVTVWDVQIRACTLLPFSKGGVSF